MQIVGRLIILDQEIGLIRLGLNESDFLKDIHERFGNLRVLCEEFLGMEMLFRWIEDGVMTEEWLVFLLDFFVFYLEGIDFGQYNLNWIEFKLILDLRLQGFESLGLPIKCNGPAFHLLQEGMCWY